MNVVVGMIIVGLLRKEYFDVVVDIDEKRAYMMSNGGEERIWCISLETLESWISDKSLVTKLIP